MEISLSADSAVLFFRFLSLFSVSEAVSPSDFAPPFNDSIAMSKTHKSV